MIRSTVSWKTCHEIDRDAKKLPKTEEGGKCVCACVCVGVFANVRVCSWVWALVSVSACKCVFAGGLAVRFWCV